MVIAKYNIKKILVDNKSSTDLLLYEAFQKMSCHLTGQRRYTPHLMGSMKALSS